MDALRADDPAGIGPYRLVGRLGAGGMGRVYLARSPAGELVAVKVIRPELADSPDFRARFAREVAAARAVSGEYTAAVVDADLDADQPWLATTYVPGLSLSVTVSRHGPLPEAALTVFAAGLVKALIAVHAAGIVHRDLKPSNVMLAADGPRVIDFGVSRAADASALTQTGAMIGSPGFMSPEQMTGGEIGEASDIFSLGALVAYAATGREPFGVGPTPAQVYRVVHAEPNLDGIPDGLRGIIADCLAKDPADRPTPDALWRRLTSAEQATAVLTGPFWPPSTIIDSLRDEDAAVRTALAVNVIPPPVFPSPAATPPGDSRPGAVGSDDLVVRERAAGGGRSPSDDPGRRGRLVAGMVALVLLAGAIIAGVAAAAGGSGDDSDAATSVTAHQPDSPASTEADRTVPAGSSPSVTVVEPKVTESAIAPPTSAPAGAGGTTSERPGPAPGATGQHPNGGGSGEAPQRTAPTPAPQPPAAQPPAPQPPAAHVFTVTGNLGRQSCAAEGSVVSARTLTGVRVTFRNQSPEPIRIYWLDFYGARVAAAPAVVPGDSYSANSYQGHLWLVAHGSTCLAIADAGAAGGTLTIR